MPSTATNSFALFGLPQQYQLDRQKLEECYRQESFQSHPDLAADDPQAQQIALERTALVNQAFQTLSDDTKRAQLLLTLLLEDRSLETDQLPPGFLQEMFALQEQTDELLSQESDPAVSSEEKQTSQTLQEQTEARRDKLLQQRNQLFTMASASTPSSLEVLQSIQNNLNCERYLNRLIFNLKGKETDL